MNNEQENFEKLRLLLTIKRYEQPPPGYFNGLSHEIMARIRAGEADVPVSIFQGFGLKTSWLQRLWDVLDTKPVLAGSLGVAVCGLVLAGLAFNMAPENQPAANLQVEQILAGNLPSVQRGSSVSVPSTMATMPVFGAVGAVPMFASTGTVMSLAPQSAFPQGQHLSATPILTGFYQ